MSDLDTAQVVQNVISTAYVAIGPKREDESLAEYDARLEAASAHIALQMSPSSPVSQKVLRLLNSKPIPCQIIRLTYEESSKRYVVTYKANAPSKWTDKDGTETIRTTRTDTGDGDVQAKRINAILKQNDGQAVLFRFAENVTEDNPKGHRTIAHVAMN